MLFWKQRIHGTRYTLKFDPRLKTRFLRVKIEEARNAIRLKRRKAKESALRYLKAEWAIALCNSWLWIKVSSSSSKAIAANVELCIDFVANKMNKAWSGLEKAPPGSLKNKIHGVGISLLSCVKPSKIFLIFLLNCDNRRGQHFFT